MLKWIVAMDEDRTIWFEGNIPRHNKEDLLRFKELTKDQICILWQKTFDWLTNIESRKKLRDTHQKEWYPYAKEQLILHRDNLQNILDYTQDKVARVLWWAKTFETLLPYIDEIFLTLIPWQHKWDTFMPSFESNFFLSEETTWESCIFRKYSRKQ